MQQRQHFFVANADFDAVALMNSLLIPTGVELSFDQHDLQCLKHHLDLEYFWVAGKLKSLIVKIILVNNSAR